MADFELVAGPFQGPTGGVVWDGRSILFTTIDAGQLLRFDPATQKVEEVRRYTNRVNGLALGPDGELYGAQEGGRRLVEFPPDGRVSPVDAPLEGKYHNQPSDLVVDRRHRIWFADPIHPVAPFGPAMFPFLDHCSVLRLQRNDRNAWTTTRITFDTASPRAVLLSEDETTLYVTDGLPRDGMRRELRAYPIQADGSVGPYLLLHAFGADHRGPQRGVEGMCLDAGGNIVACAGWRQSGPGPMIHVFGPNGAVLETHAVPADEPNKCCFGGPELDTLYVTTAGGHLYAGKLGRRGRSAARDANARI